MSTIELLTNKEYKYGFVTDIETDMIPKGLSEDTVRLISEKKNEPEWMLEFRLKAYRQWLKMTEPKHWPNFNYPRDRFSGHHLLQRAEAEGVRRRASTRLIPNCSARSRSWASP